MKKRDVNYFFCVTTDLVRKFEAELPTLRFRPPIQKVLLRIGIKAELHETVN